MACGFLRQSVIVLVALALMVELGTFAELAGWARPLLEYNGDAFSPIPLPNGFPEAEVIIVSADAPATRMSLKFNGIKNSSVVYNLELQLDQNVVVQNSFANDTLQGEQRTAFEREDVQKISVYTKRVVGGYSSCVFTLSSSNPPQLKSLKLDYEDRIPAESVVEFGVSGVWSPNRNSVTLQHTENIELGGEKDCFEYHTSYVGNEFKKTTADNPEACQQVCRSGIGCFFFTFAYEDGSCSLKSRIGRRTVNDVPRMVSGPRYCTGWSEDHKSYSIPTNLARPNNTGVPVSQSSVSHGGKPENAVDGNRNMNFYRGSCTHTSLNGSEKGWLEAKLRAPTMVEAVTLYNRGDSCQRARFPWGCAYRLSRFRVLVDGELCLEQISPLRAGVATELFCNKPLLGTTVRIQHLDGRRQWVLTICELEIYGREVQLF